MIIFTQNKFDFCPILCYHHIMQDIKAIRKIVEDLFELQQRRGFPLYELAEMFHVDERTIRRWFKMENVPRPVYIPMIKKLLEIDKEKKSKKL